MKFASQVFLDTGSLDPMWVADTDEGKVVIGTQFDGDESKDAIAAYIKTAIAPRAHRLVFMCEAWMRVIPGKDYDGIRPSESPDRIEAIYLVAEDVGGRQIMITRKIIRPEGGKPQLLPEEVIENKDGNDLGGRFANLLKRSGVLH